MQGGKRRTKDRKERDRKIHLKSRKVFRKGGEDPTKRKRGTGDKTIWGKKKRGKKKKH